MKVSQKSRITPFMKQCFVTAAVGCNIISHGAAIGYPAVMLPQLLGHYPGTASGPAIPLSPTAASWIASVMGITQVIGSFVSPPIMTHCGRKVAHIAVTIPILVGWFILTMATTFEELFAARVLQGLSIGLLSPLRSVIVGEYSSPKNRGALLTTVSLAQAFGVFFVHLVGSFLSWQATALVCVFFAFASLLMTLYSPESPSWLVTRGRYEECREVFRWIRGPDEEDELEEMIQARMLFEDARIIQKNTRKMNKLEEMIDTIKKKEFYKPIIIMIFAYIMVNFAGGTTMATYSTTIITLVMGPDVNPHFWMIFLDTQRLITNSIAVFVINKLKRRTVLFSTGALCVFSQVALAIYTYAKSEGMLRYDAVWIPAVLINIQFFTVATGMLPLPNVIGGEVFPLEYRSIAGSISQVTLSASFFVVVQTFTGLVDSVHIYGAYAVYSVLLVVCLLVVWFLLPETKGKTLQQIEDEFRGRPLTYNEMQSKMSLHSCPVTAYKNMVRKNSTPLI